MGTNCNALLLLLLLLLCWYKPKPMMLLHQLSKPCCCCTATSAALLAAAITSSISPILLLLLLLLCHDLLLQCFTCFAAAAGPSHAPCQALLQLLQCCCRLPNEHQLHRRGTLPGARSATLGALLATEVEHVALDALLAEPHKTLGSK
jgi:hypothetical protein